MDSLRDALTMAFNGGVPPEDPDSDVRTAIMDVLDRVEAKKGSIRKPRKESSSIASSVEAPAMFGEYDTLAPNASPELGLKLQRPSQSDFMDGSRGVGLRDTIANLYGQRDDPVDGEELSPGVTMKGRASSGVSSEGEPVGIAPEVEMEVDPNEDPEITAEASGELGPKPELEIPDKTEPESSTMRADLERSVNNLDTLSRKKQGEIFMYMAGAQKGMRGNFANMLTQETANEARRQLALDKSNTYQVAGPGLLFNRLTGELLTADQYLIDQNERKLKQIGLKGSDARELAKAQHEFRRDEETLKAQLKSGMAITAYQQAMINLNNKKQAWLEKHQGVMEQVAQAKAAQQKEGKEAGFDKPLTQQQLTQGTRGLSKDLKDIAPLGSAFTNMTKMVESYPSGASIPGIGIASNVLRRATPEAQYNNSIVQTVANNWMRKNSGLNVTDQEKERVIAQMATGGTYTQDQFLKVLPLLYDDYNASVRNTTGGYHPQVRSEYEKQSGLSLNTLPYPRQGSVGKTFQPQGGPAHAPSVEDNRSIDQLLKQY